MLRSSVPLLDYFGKVRHLPVNHVRPRHLAARRPHRASPFANKMRPSAIANTEDQRRGIDWYNRIRKRKEYRHWPFIKNSDDLMRRHKNPEDAPSRAFSVFDSKTCLSGKPLWNYYKETSRDYRTDVSCPANYMAEFISVFTAKVWSKQTIAGFLKKAEANGFKTIANIVDDGRAFFLWNRKTNAMPHYLAVHALMCATDIKEHEARRAHRQKMQQSAVLRTSLMGRYYALPYLRVKENASVPVAQRQPVGVYPEGEYLYTRAAKLYAHPIQGVTHFQKDYN